MLKQMAFYCVALAIAFLATNDAAAQNDVFGYPTGGCASGGCGQVTVGGHQGGIGNGQFRARLDATQAQNDKIYARNEAWPKPFSCASRQLYHNLWTPMYAAGWEDQNILTGTHFNEKGELTSYGKQQVSSMLASMPQYNRTIFVQKTADPNLTQMRMATVQNLINTVHPHRAANAVASNRSPQTLSGLNAVNIIERRAANAPNPTIPIANASTGVNVAVQGN